MKHCSYEKPPEIDFSRSFIEGVSRQQTMSLFEPELALGAELELKLETTGLAWRPLVHVQTVHSASL